jgi:hypothetical protein
MKKIKINKTLFAEEIELGEGAILLLPYATPPIIKFLRRKYKEDPTCISGDIDYLVPLRKHP